MIRSRKKPRVILTREYPVLPGTHNRETGFFSLCEGHNGRIYLGTHVDEAYAYLVEFDPVIGRQRIAVDTARTLGLSVTGYAAQAKIHTPNFVGPSGTIYFGTKAGYGSKIENAWSYRGGYVLTYDPATSRARSLGRVPIRGHGVGDVIADEGRGVLYIVTCQDQYRDQMWLKYDVNSREFTILGPPLCLFGTTLIGADGRVFALTRDYKLASYDPQTDETQVRPITLDGDDQVFNPVRGVKLWNRLTNWTADKEHEKAYLIMLQDPTLYEISLNATGPTVPARALGPMIRPKRLPTDTRSALRLHPDGRLYALIRADADYHLVRFTRATGEVETLGLIPIETSSQLDKGDSPNQGMCIAHDGTIYALNIKPFHLMRIDEFCTSKSNRD